MKAIQLWIVLVLLIGGLALALTASRLDLCIWWCHLTPPPCEAALDECLGQCMEVGR